MTREAALEALERIVGAFESFSPHQRDLATIRAALAPYDAAAPEAASAKREECARYMQDLASQYDEGGNGHRALMQAACLLRESPSSPPREEKPFAWCLLRGGKIAWDADFCFADSRTELDYGQEGDEVIPVYVCPPSAKGAPGGAPVRTFTMYRRSVPTDTHDENQRNASDQPQFEGALFSDGTVAVRWLTAKRSTSVWQSMDDMLAIHGHPEYGSELVWHAAAPSPTGGEGER